MGGVKGRGGFPLRRMEETKGIKEVKKELKSVVEMGLRLKRRERKGLDSGGWRCKGKRLSDRGLACGTEFWHDWSSRRKKLLVVAGVMNP